ncbi:MAG TPA: PAS domain S-box protein [Mucilaginibacter sp.]|nr:PAS domain S-box protein [Mucilaginibacter sp.]
MILPVDHTGKGNNYYKAIFDNSLSGIFLTVPGGNVLDSNQAALDIFGYSAEEMRKQTRETLFDSSDENFISFLTTRGNEGSAKGELTGIRKNGEHFPCEVSSAVFNDENGELRTIVNLNDISDRRTIKREVHNRQRLLNAIVTNTNDGLAVTDKNGHFLIFNEAMIGLLGAGPVDSETYDWSKKYNIYHQDGETMVATDKLPIVRALHGEKIKDETYLIKNPKRGNVYLSISASPVKDESGEIIGSLVVDRDITDQFLYQENLKRANDELTSVMGSLLASNERFFYVMKATNDAIWDMDLKTYHIQWGEGYEKLFGYKLEENAGNYSEWKSKVYPEDMERVVSSIEKSIAKKENYIWEEEYRYIKHDGTIAHVYDRGYIIYARDGTPIRMVGAMQDITDRKAYETERSKLIDDLIKQNKNLEQFTYIISHNLRSPVANIMGCAQMLKDEDLTPAERESFVDGLGQSIGKLDEVISDLHTILQLKNNINEKKENVNLTEIFEDVKTSLDNLIRESGAVVQGDFNVTMIRSIKSFIYSIFLNLISNSIKYKRQDIKPCICISAAERDGMVLLNFADNGLGIDLTTKGDDLFGLYKRFHSHVEGKGLGLFMVKTQIETMKGKIAVHSRPGDGTRFEIELPLT